MADRENIINHFRDAIEASGNNNKWRFVRVDVIEDAVELLKEQEPVEPKWASGIKGSGDALCGSCWAWLFDHSWAYCPRCGKAVKWDDCQ